ncbi:MAG: hypothetical protein M3203_03690, partial [Actinomycetota bacterium]|nr:hypothetical protein [Actinomycetota bacterium]
MTGPHRRMDEADRDGRWRAARQAVLLVMAIAVPVVFDTGVRPSFALPKVTVLAAGASVLVALALAEWARRGAWPWRNRLELTVLAFLAWTALSAVASDEPRRSLLGARESLNGLVTVAVLVVVFFAAARDFEVGRVRTALAVLWFGAGGAVLAYGAVQLGDRLTHGGSWDPVPWSNPLGAGAIWSTLGNPNDLAGFLAVVLPVGLVLLVTATSRLVRALGATMVG